MKRLAILITALIIILVGCNATTEPTTEATQPTSETTTQVATTTEQTTTQTTTEVATTTVAETTADPNIPGEGEVYSAINGTVISEASAAQRPLAVMMDNFYAARPQAGLNAADIVYEAYVEGRITRYMAVFQSHLPELIGPIRSSRPYYLRLAMEYDAYYAHVGGSMQAMTDIINFQMADVDGLASGKDTFWRKKHKKIPNNMYASSESLIAWANRRKYRTEAKFDSWKFGDDYGAQDAEKLTGFEITYRQGKGENDKFHYVPGFDYDEKSGKYLRKLNGEAYLDEVTEEQLYADSIIIQCAKTRVIDSYGRLAIDVVGSGKGYYLYDGVAIPITWKKDARRERTRYYTADGDALVLKRGKIWVQLVKPDFELVQKGE